jgi:hypothetical protein
MAATPALRSGEFESNCRFNQSGRCSIIDVIAEKFGYSRSGVFGKSEAVGSGEVVASLPPHLKDGDGFEWPRAKRTGASYSYNDDDVFHYAVGKPDMIPVKVAATFLVGVNQISEEALKSEFSRKMWLSPGNRRFASWFSSNEKVMSAMLSKQMPPIREPDQDVDHDDFGKRVFSQLPGGSVSYLFRKADMSANPDLGIELLGVSKEFNAYLKHDVISSAERTARAALDQTTQWTLQWFEAHGFEVDYGELLIRMDGYQPLFYMDVTFQRNGLNAGFPEFPTSRPFILRS